VSLMIQELEQKQEENSDTLSDFIDTSDYDIDSDADLDNILPFKIDPNKLN